MLCMDDVWSKIIALSSKTDIERITLSQLATLLGLKFRSQAKHYKEKAIADNLIVRNTTGRLVPAPSKDTKSVITIPVMGAANCGPATTLALNEVTGSISISPSVIKKKAGEGYFAVMAIGDSMNRANIKGENLEDGDYAIIEPTVWHDAADGDYVLSIIDEVTNIKKMKIDSENQRIVLHSESADYIDDIIIAAEDLFAYRIAGRVVGVVKGRV